MWSPQNLRGLHSLDIWAQSHLCGPWGFLVYLTNILKDAFILNVKYFYINLYMGRVNAVFLF